ncbi:pilus assembly protein TadB [Photobacterium proteolyticum]|uniref:Pilus assembly protein TadB n=1 Tax=Photobacterium proteolyticum TaxID=1903952 RepID=A0A1Q9H1I5_9GAMM|nr:type II secretion system F family protein [Photobacterium proteolyticum]OLQ81641.1 pilus assembly protein TadB [Photobacterium proteolyticum]
MMWLALFPLVILVIGYWWEKKKVSRNIEAHIRLELETAKTEVTKTVINADKFDDGWKVRIKTKYKNVLSLLSPNPARKIGLFMLIACIALYILDVVLINQGIIIIYSIGLPLGFTLFLIKLNQLQASRFKKHFPDALNILSGALSSGQSIIHAFEYVGNQMDNEVGEEFKLMSERLLIGEDPDDVLERSGEKFPYIEYFFFVSTIRINLSRGGQLKEIINRINRIMFEARSIDKKKSALTSEARASAKIIAALPVIFLIILRFTSPENYNFVMFEEGGKPIFYYVLISELIGFICLSLILRGVD